jgi:cysteine desulfurase / selenocysteine lyase
MNTEKKAESKLKNFRSQFPHIRRGVLHLNNAAQAPLPGVTVSAVQEHLFDRHDGMLMTFPKDMKVASECRERIRNLLNAPDAHQIAFVTNTSEGLNRVTSGLSWRAGDEIILNNIEFPANIQPYRKLESRGVRCTYVDANDGTIPIDRIEAAITVNTRMIAISAVQFLSGYRADLAAIGELCRKYEMLFVVDGIQAAGITPVDVQAWGIDAFSSGGHKWLMAPAGIGFLYLSERLCRHLKTPDPGWLSVENPWDMLRYNQPLRSDALRYEGGVTNMAGIHGLNASLKLLLDTGVDLIFEHVMSCNRQLRDGLAGLGLQPYSTEDPDRQSGIITFHLHGDIDRKSLEQVFRDRNIHLTARDNKLRLAPHGFITPDEIETVIHETESIYSEMA